ncbi:MAG: uracil-DNA glycosylase [Spirochaetes bacterium]|nr:uracil-DNA glycosylase [Spirochaetota bacterium]
MTGPRPRPVDCRACRHFWITWQGGHPYGCRAFQMVCQGLPSAHVRQQSGEDCLYFEPKPPRKSPGKEGPPPAQGKDGWLA